MLVFVYGTLMSGQYNNPWLEDCTLLGDFTTPPCYTMVNLGAFPAVLLGGDTAITGEVWEAPDDILNSLDVLEGYPLLYNRTLINTTHGYAWMYYNPREELNNDPIITNGKWREPCYQ